MDQLGQPSLVQFLDDDRVQPLAGNMFGQFWVRGEPLSIADVRILAPVFPSKVVGIGSNYVKHISEMGRPTPQRPKVFLKPNTSVVGPRDSIQIPPQTTRVDHEAELGIVIGKHTFCVPKEDVWSHILGLTIVNDVTARDFQKEDGIFTRGKGFDTFCPLGPFIEMTHSKSSISRTIQCWVNDELRQNSETGDMLFGIEDIVVFVSNIMTLFPGDIIATGTPSGVGPLMDGDVVKIEIEGLGQLINPVVNRADRCQLLS